MSEQTTSRRKQRLEHQARDFASRLTAPADGTREAGLSNQVYGLIRRAIIMGAFKPGTKIPSSRSLAQKLGVSRSTVVDAFEQLLADGFVSSQIGSGTFINNAISGRISSVLNEPEDGHRSVAPAMEPRFTDLGFISPDEPRVDVKPFSTGCTSIDRLSQRRIGTILRGQVAETVCVGGSYASPAGLLRLREQISKHVYLTRGVICDPSRVVIVSGSQQAIYIALRSLLHPGDAIWLEDPCYPPAWAVAQAVGAEIVGVAVDGSGMCITDGLAQKLNARVAYVTPSHQYPTGVVMSLERRLELLDWANKSQSWIIEDDYDSDFHYGNRSISSLQGLANKDNVVYIGTFSKVLDPSLRVGYIVAPHRLNDVIVRQKFLIDRHSPTFHQNLLAEFMERGFLDGHLSRMNRKYKSTCDTLVSYFSAQADARVRVMSAQGVHITLTFTDPLVSDVAVAVEAASLGVTVRPISQMAFRNRSASGLLLGITGFPDSALLRSAHILSEIIARHPC